MARYGDSERKQREAYQQHNGRIAGTLKWLAVKLNPLNWGDDD